MSTLPVYDQLSRKHLGFDYEAHSKNDILRRIQEQIDDVKSSFSTEEEKTTDLGQIKIISSGESIIDAGNKIQTLLFQKGDDIYQDMVTKNEIDIDAISKHIEKVATYAFLCQLKEHIDKHDKTGKYLSPLMFFDFQRLRKDKDMRKALKVSEFAYPDRFLFRLDNGTFERLIINGASDGSDEYSMLDDLGRSIGRKKILGPISFLDYGDDDHNIDEIDRKFTSEDKLDIDLPATTRAFGFGKGSSSPIVDAWVQRFVGSAKKTTEVTTPIRLLAYNEIIVSEDDLMIPFPNSIDAKDVNASRNYYYAELSMAKVLKTVIDKAKTKTRIRTFKVPQNDYIKMIINSEGIKSKIKKALDNVFDYTNQVKKFVETEALRDKIKAKAQLAFKDEGMAYNMVQYLLDALDSYQIGPTTRFTKEELFAINKALIDATSAFTNVITDNKSIKRQVEEKETEVKNKFSGITADPTLSAELSKLIHENGHPVYLDEFLDKKEHEKKITAIKTRVSGGSSSSASTRASTSSTRASTTSSSSASTRGTRSSSRSSSSRSSSRSPSPSYRRIGSSGSTRTVTSSMTRPVTTSRGGTITGSGGGGGSGVRRTVAPKVNPTMAKRGSLSKSNTRTKTKTSMPPPSPRKKTPTRKKTLNQQLLDTLPDVTTKRSVTAPSVASDSSSVTSDSDYYSARETEDEPRFRKPNKNKDQRRKTQRRRLFDDSSSKMDEIVELSDEEFSKLEVPSSGTDLSDVSESDLEEDDEMLYMLPKCLYEQNTPVYQRNHSFSKSIYKY